MSNPMFYGHSKSCYRKGVGSQNLLCAICVIAWHQLRHKGQKNSCCYCKRRHIEANPHPQECVFLYWTDEIGIHQGVVFFLTSIFPNLVCEFSHRISKTWTAQMWVITRGVCIPKEKSSQLWDALCYPHSQWDVLVTAVCMVESLC